MTEGELDANDVLLEACKYIDDNEYIADEMSKMEDVDLNDALSTACAYEHEDMAYNLVMLGAKYCKTCNNYSHDDLDNMKKDAELSE